MNFEILNQKIDEKILDKEWNALLKDNYVECQKTFDNTAEQVEKDWLSRNVSKSDCNVKISTIGTCVSLKSYSVKYFHFT